MENTEELDIDIDDIGTILKSSRLKQKKSMEEISSELCIRKIYLTALEEGDYETLPPIPYGVGYVRTYARYLGLNPERAVKLYKTASAAEEEVVEVQKETPEVNKSSSKHIVVGILALAAIYGGWNWYTLSVAPKVAERVQQEGVVAEDNHTHELAEAINEEEQSGDILPNAEENIVAETVETAEAIPQTPITETQPVEEPAPEIKENKVVVEFLGESWVELKDKSKVYFQGVFHQGDKKEIDYTDNLFLSVGRPQNVKVYIKGAEKDILVKRRKMNIPLDSLN